MTHVPQMQHGANAGQIYYAAVPRQSVGYVDRGGRNSQSQNQQNKSRRLYVGNIPYHVGIAENGMVQLFSALYVAGFRPLAPGEPLPVTSFWLHADGKFGFMELRGDSEAVDIMQLNGVVLHGRPLRINRPSDYRPEIHGAINIPPSRINIAGINELCSQLGGILAPPAHLVALAEAQNVVPAQSNGQSTTSDGTVDAAKLATEYPPETHTEQPESSNTVPLPSESLSAEHVSNPMSDSAPTEPNSAGPNDVCSRPAIAETRQSEPASGKRPSAEENSTESRSKAYVVSLRNLVSDEDLDGSQEDYNDLVEDVKEECATYGAVLGISIPRSGSSRGTAYISYTTEEEATRAIDSLRQRVFNGMAIEAVIVQGVSSTEEAVAKCV